MARLCGARLRAINLFLRPLLILLTLPAVILTLGILILFINAFLLWLTGAIFDEHFAVADFFWAAILGAIVIGIVNILLSLLIPQPTEERGTTTAPAETNL